MLDSKTKLGIAATIRVKEALDRLGRRNGVTHLWFPDGNTLPVDGFLSVDGHIAGIFEAKSRNIEFEKDWTIKYKGDNYDDYLITKQKIDDGADMSKQFSLPFFLLVYCELSGHVLSFKITDDSGNVTIKFSEKKTRTQKTVNGSIAYRLNAYIPIAGQAMVWNPKKLHY